jgi:hypothetical protein
MAEGKLRWRMERPCDNCPFSDSPGGTAMRKSLRPGRMAEIKRSLRQGAAFHCHKTTVDMIEDDDGNVTDVGKNALLCAGAIEWGNQHGASSNYQRVCERLDAIRATREGKKT